VAAAVVEKALILISTSVTIADITCIALTHVATCSVCASCVYVTTAVIGGALVDINTSNTVASITSIACAGK
jgi:hypothetical protein